MNVALYVRAPMDHTGKEEESLKGQLDRLNEYVERRCRQGDPWIVTDRVIEGVERAIPPSRFSMDEGADLPGRDILLDLASQGLIDIVAVTEIGHLADDVVEFSAVIQDLESCGVRLVSLKEGFDFTSPMGRIQFQMLSILSKYGNELEDETEDVL